MTETKLMCSNVLPYTLRYTATRLLAIANRLEYSSVKLKDIDELSKLAGMTPSFVKSANFYRYGEYIKSANIMLDAMREYKSQKND